MHCLDCILRTHGVMRRLQTGWTERGFRQCCSWRQMTGETGKWYHDLSMLSHILNITFRGWRMTASQSAISHFVFPCSDPCFSGNGMQSDSWISSKRFSSFVTGKECLFVFFTTFWQHIVFRPIAQSILNLYQQRSLQKKQRVPTMNSFHGYTDWLLSCNARFLAVVAPITASWAL